MSRNGNRILNNGGFSLPELLVVIGIISTLLGIATFFGHEWMVRAQVEGQTRELFADLMNARVSALQKNRVFFAKLAAYQYAIYEDTYDPDNPISTDGDGTLQEGNDRPVKQKATAYALERGSSPATFNFSSCGLASEASYTIHVTSTAEPSFDCIVLNPTRILMGKWNGTDCSLQ